ncbi:MAG: DUF3344 domain-containing protein [Methanomicrobiales archaeon]|nr:DUF3344 domain-containing protein [Methanomicrobiales archaeon]
MRRRTIFLITLILILLCGAPCSAVYNFGGIPLEITAQGEVPGRMHTYGVYGLDDPPFTLTFEIDGGVQWARTYVGVWGGTPRYTGWTDLTVNGRALPRIRLYGSDDKSENVYITGYGVYWVAYDTTSLLTSGRNTIIADSSRFEPDNKLDGRIYSVVTLAAVSDASGITTQYWVAEGNQNLHGEGWGTGSHSTTLDECSVTFPASDIRGVQAANLTIKLLTSTRGEPSYVQFNSHDLGPDVDYPGYPAGVKDIADETSFNAGYYNPIKSRYVDIEVFDVLSLLKKGDNVVTFQRGRDLDGDGIISAAANPPEGEHYLHPVLAMLTLERPRAGATGPDLMLDTIEVKGALAGEEGVITLTIRNLGVLPSVPADVRVRVNGALLEARRVTIDRSGIQQVSIPWNPEKGVYTIQGEVDIPGDLNPLNNKKEKEVTVGTVPDLAVSIEDPYRPGDAVQQGSATLQVLVIGAALALALLLFARRPPGRYQKILPLLLCAMVLVSLLPPAVVPAAAQGTSQVYLLPVTVTNLGGSDASSFILSVYLDGEKVMNKDYPEGLKAGGSERSELPIYASPGSHTVKVVVDEDGLLKDSDRSNNVAEGTYVFS